VFEEKIQGVLTQSVMKKILLIIFIAFPSIADARCQGAWEVSSLARGTHSAYNLNAPNGQTLISLPIASIRKLDEISRAIDRQSGVYKKFFICGNRSLNAFATKVSGAKAVFINTGFIKKAGSDWDLYAALLGHENAHLVHHHGSQRQMRKLGINLLGLLAQAALNSFAGQGSMGRAIGEEAINLGGSAVYANYSRDDESEADQSGLNYAYRAGFDPHGSIRLHQLLNGSSDFFSSHPSSAERISALTSQIAYLTNNQTRVASTIQPRVSNTNSMQSASSIPSTPVLSSSNSSSTTAIAQDKGVNRSLGSGVVLKVKSRYRYFIASQTDFISPVKGMTVSMDAGSKNISGTVERVIGGYFSVLVNVAIDDAIVGRKVTFK
jgi:Zn-dependent protease with chaperone function